MLSTGIDCGVEFLEKSQTDLDVASQDGGRKGYDLPKNAERDEMKVS
jgi:hypothetical protein